MPQAGTEAGLCLPNVALDFLKQLLCSLKGQRGALSWFGVLLHGAACGPGRHCLRRCCKATCSAPGGKH